MSRLLLIPQIVKHCLFGGFEFEVLDGFFEFVHGLALGLDWAIIPKFGALAGWIRTSIRYLFRKKLGR